VQQQSFCWTAYTEQRTEIFLIQNGNAPDAEATPAGFGSAASIFMPSSSEIQKPRLYY